MFVSLLQTVTQEKDFPIWSSSSWGRGTERPLRSSGVTMCSSVSLMSDPLTICSRVTWGACGKCRFMAPEPYYVSFSGFKTGNLNFKNHPLWFFFRQSLRELRIFQCSSSPCKNPDSLNISNRGGLILFGGSPWSPCLALCSASFPQWVKYGLIGRNPKLKLCVCE